MRSLLHNHSLWKLMTVVMMVLVFILSSQGGVESGLLSDRLADRLHVRTTNPSWTPSIQPLFLGLNLRKLAHLSLYALLGLFSALSVKNIARMPLSCLCMYGYACLDELHQVLVPGRTGLFMDTMIDLMGIALGTLLAFAIRALMGRRDR